MVIIHDITLKL